MGPALLPLHDALPASAVSMGPALLPPQAASAALPASEALASTLSFRPFYGLT